MSIYFKELIESKLKYYSLLLEGMTELLTPQAFIYYILFFSEYLTCRFREEYRNDPNKVTTGAASVFRSTKMYSLLNIVLLRNAIVHYDSKKIIECLDYFIEVDLNDENFTTNDNLTLEGLCLITRADLKSVKAFFTTKF